MSASPEKSERLWRKTCGLLRKPHTSDKRVIQLESLARHYRALMPQSRLDQIDGERLRKVRG